MASKRNDFQALLTIINFTVGIVAPAAFIHNSESLSNLNLTSMNSWKYVLEQADSLSSYYQFGPGDVIITINYIVFYNFDLIYCAASCKIFNIIDN